MLCRDIWLHLLQHMQCVCGSGRLLTKWHIGVPLRYRDVVRRARALLLPITTAPSCFLRHVRNCSAAVSSGPLLHAQPRNDMRDFFGCYLLTSQDPKNKGRTYIGFTVNPRRRLRQHNGEITAGAHGTKRGRPWDMVLVTYGFPTKVQALQFEWAWQHPTASKAVRAAAQKIGPTAMRGAKGKVRLLFEMLNLDPWCYYPLQVQILSSAYTSLRTAKCLPPPPHVTVSTAPMEGYCKETVVCSTKTCPRVFLVMLPVVVADDFDEGPPEEQPDQEGLDESVLLGADSTMTHAMADSAASGTNLEAYGHQDLAAVLAPLPETAALSEKERRQAEKQQQKVEKEQQKELQKAEKAKEAAAKLCCLCGEKADAKWLSCSCSARSHVECLAKRFLKEAGEEQGLPVQGTCPNCGAVQKWADVLAKCESVPWRQSSKAKPRGQGKGRKAAATAPQAGVGDTEVQSTKPARSKGKGRPKAAPTDVATASDRTAAQTDTCPVTSSDPNLIDMTGADPASPAKKPKAPAPTAKAPAKSQAKSAKTLKEGAEGKPKGRQKKTEALEELVPEGALPRGPSFPFDIHRVLALGSNCGLPTDAATRDELSGQHRMLCMPSACLKTAGDPGSAVPTAIGATAVSESSASAQADCLADNHTCSDGRLCGSEYPEQLQASAGSAGRQEVPLSELSLRDRLQKVQCLLRQAGLSPAEAMLGLASPDALDAANASGAGRHTVNPTGTDGRFHGHVGSDDPIHDPDQAGSGKHSGSDSSPVPTLACGVTYDDLLINLVSPTGEPSPQASHAGTDAGSPVGLPLPAPQLSPIELDPPSQYSCLLVYAASPLALVSHALLQQQQQDAHAKMPADDVVSSGRVCQNSLDYSGQELLLPVSVVVPAASPAASPAVAEQHCGGLQRSHGVQSSASCQQSPGSSVDEVSQHGRKRSRSVPRGRKPNVGKMLKSPSQARVPSQQMHATGELDSKTASLVEDREMVDNNTPHSKTANKLAALQMSSPGCTPSPMPLRRRLQQQDRPLLQEAAPQIQCDSSKDECEVICID